MRTVERLTLLPSSPGTARHIALDTSSRTSVALTRVLCARAYEESTSPSSVRGCVPTKQLVRELPFQSKYANEENVRQVVLRLRGALSEVGVAGLLAVAPGRGYYLACKVTPARAVSAAQRS